MKIHGEDVTGYALLNYENQALKIGLAYSLWFAGAGVGAHLVYTRRWAFLACHLIITFLVLALSMGVLDENDFSLSHSAVLLWMLMLIVEAPLLYHQIQDTNARLVRRLLENRRQGPWAS